jgi:hypothetical protein
MNFRNFPELPLEKRNMGNSIFRTETINTKGTKKYASE